MFKKILLTFIIVASIAIYFNKQTAHTYSTTPPINRTGAPGQLQCSGCHGTSAALTADIVFNSGDNIYVPGETYDMAIIISHPLYQRFGFSMISWDVDNNFVGEWTASGANTQVYSTGDYVGHQNALGGQNSPFTYDVQWTAPDEGTGSVTFYAGCVAANNNGSTSGDGGKSISLTIEEAPPIQNGPVEVSLKILLEGPYIANGIMNIDGNAQIPLESPFDQAPYNFTGNNTATSIPANAVDWVLVEARGGTPNAIAPRTTVTVQTKVGFLLNNGDIVDIDGVSALTFDSLELSESYHFAIRQRNHLDVMSAVAQSAESGSIFYDFTQNDAQAYGTQQLKDLGDAHWGLYTGEFSQDGTIQTTDYDLWAAQPAIVNTYSFTDANLDGLVQVSDYDKWFPNKAKLGNHELDY